MVDNIDVDPGTGVGKKPVATDDVGGVQYQVIKIATGADGVASYISTANPLPVSNGTASVATTSGGFEYETVAASQTDQIMGATGAVGDYIEGLVCVVSTAAT